MLVISTVWGQRQPRIHSKSISRETTKQNFASLPYFMVRLLLDRSDKATNHNPVIQVSTPMSNTSHLLGLEALVLGKLVDTSIKDNYNS